MHKQTWRISWDDLYTITHIMNISLGECKVVSKICHDTVRRRYFLEVFASESEAAGLLQDIADDWVAVGTSGNLVRRERVYAELVSSHTIAPR